MLPLTNADRKARFGAFTWYRDPQPGNPEHVRVDAHWSQQNITAVRVPELGRVVFINHLAAQPLLDVFAAWRRAGLMPLVLSFDGSWVTRFKRQSGTYDERVGKCRMLGEASLSNHSWGTAFDINAKWNPLWVEPAAEGAMGTTRPLVAAAADHGWFWGGDFRFRPDGMHFEYTGR